MEKKDKIKDHLEKLQDKIELSMKETRDGFAIFLEMMNAMSESDLADYLYYQIGRGHTHYLKDTGEKAHLESITERDDRVSITGQKGNISICSPEYYYKRALNKFRLALVVSNKKRKRELLTSSMSIIEIALMKYPEYELLQCLEFQIKTTVQ